MSEIMEGQQRIEAALACIPPDLERDEWVKVGAALKHEMGDGGFDLFDAWSQQGESYDAASVSSTWRSLSAAGGVTINTLFFKAIEHGFEARATSAATVDPSELERRRAERDKRTAEEVREREMRASRAAKLAETVWRAAQAASADHPYLTRKGVAPVDTLREMDAEKLAALIGYQPKRGDDLLAGRILIAPVKISGKLSTLEMIDGDGRKSALTGGVKTGGYWATQKLTVSPKLVLIAEGVATALSASQCTGYPAIASLSVGQMEVAAKAIREHHPEASLVLLADLDKATGEPHLTAVKAAQSLDVCLAAPDFGGVRPEGATDFNDLHVARGAEVVKACIEAARIPDTGDRAPMAGIAKPPQCAAALRLAEDAIARTLAGDAGALFDIVNTLRDLRKDYPGDYARLRARIRKECREVSIGELEKQMRSDVDISDEKSMADLLIELADDRCELFHDPDNTGYALLDGGGHRQCWPVHSEGFREWLAYSFYRLHGRGPTDLSITTALATIEGKAKFDGDERRTHLRVASTAEAVWIDLCNDAWQAIEVTSTGWRIVDTPSLHFVRTSTMRALPMPTAGGNIAPLWNIVNIPEGERLLVVTWILECFRSATPYAVLELTGEQGSAKSTTQHYLRELIDPNRSNNRAAPKAVDDVFVSAQNAHLMSFENLSHLPAAYQDALCVLATGGGYSTRRLFTNTEESVIDMKKPIALNGIAVIVTAQDLSDRAVHVDLPTIEARATANEIEKAFEAHRCEIFGGLLDIFVRALAALQSVRTEALKLPRMADFAQLGEAVYRIHGKPAGAFLAEYQDKRRESVHRTIEASPVGMAILAYLDERPEGFEGSVGRLLEVLTDYRQDTEAWPKSAKGMGDAFQRLAPALRQIGIRAWKSDRRGMNGYPCSLKKIPVNDMSSANVSTRGQVHEVHEVHANGSVPANPDELHEHDELHLMQQLSGGHILISGSDNEGMEDSV